MKTKNIIFSYLLTFVVFLAVDMLWLGLVASSIYQTYLGDFLTDDVNWIAAFIFYFIFVAGVSIFAIYPAVRRGAVKNAILMGALFGFFTYGTYDLTNLATLKSWPIAIVFIDMLWGTFLSAMVSLSGYYIVKWLN